MRPSLDRVLIVSGRAGTCAATLEHHCADRPKPEVRRCATVEEVGLTVRGWLPRVILLDLVAAAGSVEEWYAPLPTAAPLVPVVLLVSERQEEHAQALLRKGAADYVLEEHAGSSLLWRTLRAAVDRAEEHGARRQELEKAVADRDRLLTLAGRVGRIGGWTIDLVRRTVEWSDEVCAIHEAPRGTTVTLDEGIEYFAPEHRATIAEHVRACARYGTPYDLELQKVTFRGRRIWVRTIGEAVRAPDGSITHIQGAFQDITEQRRAHERQLESEGRYRALFEQSLDGIFLLDGTGRILSANGAACRMLGYDEEALRRLAPGAILDPQDPRGGSALERWRQAGRAVAELTFLHRSGTRIPVEVSYVALREVDAGIRGSMLVRDVSQRKRAEAALAEAEAHYRRLVENAPYGIYALDALGRFIELNPAAEQMLQCGPGEMIGQHFSTVIAEASLSTATEGFEAVVSGRADDIEFDERIRRRSGEERLLRVTESAIREGERIIGTHGMARDITGEREQEKNLRRAQRLATVGTMIGGVAHELNNPLHAVRNFAALLLMDERSDEDREALEVIQREADRAARIVADLRQLARDSGTEDQSRTLVRLQDVVRHVIKMRRYSLDTASIRLLLDLPDELPPVLAHRPELEQVVLNLVVNAEQAMRNVERTRRLTVRVGATGNRAHIAVTDTGIGIPTAQQERIFDPFFTTRDPGEGTGLGLSLVHGIVREHGGEIHVESTVGRGATFRIELPVALDTPHEHPAGIPDREAGEEDERRTRGLRVLVVDDEPSIRHVTSRFLERRGHRVETAEEGREAMRKIAAADFDVIVSDLRMPGVDGEELFRKLRARGTGREPRMVFVTGDLDAVRTLSSAGAGGVPVLLKPVQPEELAKAVEGAVGAPSGEGHAGSRLPLPSTG